MRASLATTQGSINDLNDLVVEGNSDLTVISTDGIDDLGQIAGTTVSLGRRGHVVLLTPTGSAAWKALGTGGSFSDVDNLEQGFSPSKFINAVIAPAGSQIVKAGSDATVKSLFVGSALGGVGSGGPQLILQNGANLTERGGVTLQATGNLGGDGKFIGKVLNLGTVRPGNLSVSGISPIPACWRATGISMASC